MLWKLFILLYGFCSIVWFSLLFCSIWIVIFFAFTISLISYLIASRSSSIKIEQYFLAIFINFFYASIIKLQMSFFAFFVLFEEQKNRILIEFGFFYQKSGTFVLELTFFVFKNKNLTIIIFMIFCFL